MRFRFYHALNLIAVSSNLCTRSPSMRFRYVKVVVTILYAICAYCVQGATFYNSFASAIETARFMLGVGDQKRQTVAFLPNTFSCIETSTVYRVFFAPARPRPFVVEIAYRTDIEDKFNLQFGKQINEMQCRVDVKHDGDLACSQIHMVGAPSYEYDNGMVHHKILEFHPANFNWPWYDAIELELQVVVPPANHVSEVVSATLVVRENFPIR